jgi:hypothetical protein
MRFSPSTEENTLDLMDVLGSIYDIVLVDSTHKLYHSTWEHQRRFYHVGRKNIYRIASL